MRKLLLRLLLLALFVAVVVISLIYFLSVSPLVSESQEEIINLFGFPYQFEITYLPSGDENEPLMIRKEIWYYPIQEIKITFLGGSVFETSPLSPEEISVSQTSLRPQEFHFDQNLDDIEELLGSQNIEKVDFLPGFYESGEVETYLSDKAIFIIEYGKLSYFQTLGSFTGDTAGVLDVGASKEDEQDMPVDMTAEKERPEDSADDSILEGGDE